MAKAKSTRRFIPREGAQSEAAWHALRAELDALPVGALQPRRAQVGPVVSEALRIADELIRPEVKARLALLPRDLFEPRYLVTLKPAALALYWCHTQSLTANVQVSEALVSPDLIDEATARKRRMIKVIAYHLGDQEDVAAELADIQTGVGYEDLASDLMRLAKLYREHRAELAEDARYFQASDEVAACTDAEKITGSMRAAGNEVAAMWADQVARAWTFLQTTYEREVRPAARFVFRADADVDARFPSLVGATRVVSVQREETPAEPTAPEGGSPKDGPK